MNAPWADPGQRKTAMITARTNCAVARAAVKRLTAEAEHHGDRSRLLARHLVDTFGMFAAVEGLISLGFPPAKTVTCLVNAGYDELDVELAILELEATQT